MPVNQRGGGGGGGGGEREGGLGVGPGIGGEGVLRLDIHIWLKSKIYLGLVE